MSGNRIKMIGDRYGRLTVIKELDRRGNSRYFLCKCDCGKDHPVRMSSLRNGTIRSCGCLRDERARETNTHDHTNKRFGRLVAIKIIDRFKGKNINVWACVCDCGKDNVLVRSDHLNSGEVRSCGCLKKDQDHKNLTLKMQERYIEGVKVPNLKAKIRSDNSSGHKGVFWAKREKKWQARIKLKGKEVHLGHFVDKIDAIRTRENAEEKYHKPYIDKLEEKLAGESESVQDGRSKISPPDRQM